MSRSLSARIEYARHKPGSVRCGRQPQQQVGKGGARKRHVVKFGHAGPLCGWLANALYHVAARLGLIKQRADGGRGGKTEEGNGEGRRSKTSVKSDHSFRSGVRERYMANAECRTLALITRQWMSGKRQVLDTDEEKEIGDPMGKEADDGEG